MSDDIKTVSISQSLYYEIDTLLNNTKVIRPSELSEYARKMMQLRDRLIRETYGVYGYVPPTNALDRVYELVFDDRKIDAIRLYRAIKGHGIGLKKAKGARKGLWYIQVPHE